MGDPSVGSLDRLLDVIASVPEQTLRYEVRKLRAIREWALDQVGVDYAVGDAVRIVAGFRVNPVKSYGWAGYQEALAAGARAKVVAIDFNISRRRWYVQIVLDREWSVTTVESTRRWWHGPADETPEGFEPPDAYEREHYSRGRKHTFTLLVTEVTKDVERDDDEPDD